MHNFHSSLKVHVSTNYITLLAVPLLDLEMSFLHIHYFSHWALIMLDPPLPFPQLIQRNFSWSSHYSKVFQGIEWFSQLPGLQSLTVLSMLIRGITITLIAGDWPPYRQLCYVTLF